MEPQTPSGIIINFRLPPGWTAKKTRDLTGAKPSIYPCQEAAYLRSGVIVFPGSNCDHDAYHVLGHAVGSEVKFIWHKEPSLPPDLDFVVVPGGFSYGDALRSGAIARFSPIMNDILRFAAEGGLVLGICNGFQVLCESGLLPGALTRNSTLRFACKNVYIRTETVSSPFTSALSPGQVLTVPIAHGEGNFVADSATIEMLEKEDRIAFRYSSASGDITAESNPNGSMNNIAGILNEGRNVLGMMPHPERCSDAILGGTDGLGIFNSVLAAVRDGSLSHVPA